MFPISQETFPTTKKFISHAVGKRPDNQIIEGVFRHCERSEAIHARTLDCFTAFAMTAKRAF
jgi:hypothetical protein